MQEGHREDTHIHEALHYHKENNVSELGFAFSFTWLVMLSHFSPSISALF